MDSYKGNGKPFRDEEVVMEEELSGVEAALELRRLRLNLGQLESSFDALTQSKAQSEAREKALAQAIRTIAETLIPERMTEMARQDPLGFGVMPPAEMARLVQVEAASKMYRLEAARIEANAAREKELEAKLRDADESLSALRAREAALRAELDESLARLRSTQERVAALLQTEASPSAPSASSTVQEGEDRSAILLRIVATTGISRRKEIEGILREQHGVPDGGSMHRLFDRALEAGWLVRSRPRAEVRGRNTELVKLSEAGKQRVREELAVDPVPSEWEQLAARHGSDAHVLLTLDAADHLRRFGATAVDTVPVPTPTPDGGTFAPDIVAVLDGRPVYVECERRTRKDPVARDRKWANYHQATRDFHIICPDENAYKAIVSEITAWAMENGKGVRLYVTSLEHADRLWTLEREILPRVMNSARRERWY